MLEMAFILITDDAMDEFMYMYVGGTGDNDCARFLVKLSCK